MTEYNKVYEELIKLLAEEETEFENRLNIFEIIEKLTQHLENLDIKRHYNEIYGFVHGHIKINYELMGSLDGNYIDIFDADSGEGSIYFHEINRRLFDYFSIYENNGPTFEKSYKKGIKRFFYNVFRLEVDELCCFATSDLSIDRSPLLDNWIFLFERSSCEEIKTISEYLHKYNMPLNWLEIKSLKEELLFLFDNDLDSVYPVIKLMVIRKVQENIFNFSNFKTTYSFLEQDLFQKRKILDGRDDLFQKQLYDELYEYVKNKDNSFVKEKIDVLENIIHELKKRELDNIHNKLMKELTDRVNNLNLEREKYKSNAILNKATHTPILKSTFFNSKFRLNGILSQRNLDYFLGEYKKEIITNLKKLIKNNWKNEKYPEIGTLSMCQFDIGYLLHKNNLSIDNDLYFDILFENYNLWKSGHKKNETFLLSMIERGRNNEKTK